MKAENTVKGAAKRAEVFHGKKARVVASVDFEVPAALVYLGEGVAIEYRSNKPLRGSRKPRVYRHKFGRGVKVYCDPKGKSLIVAGGRFAVTDWMRY